MVDRSFFCQWTTVLLLVPLVTGLPANTRHTKVDDVLAPVPTVLIASDAKAEKAETSSDAAFETGAKVSPLHASGLTNGNTRRTQLLADWDAAMLAIANTPAHINFQYTHGLVTQADWTPQVTTWTRPAMLNAVSLALAQYKGVNDELGHIVPASIGGDNMFINWNPRNFFPQHAYGNGQGTWKHHEEQVRLLFEADNVNCAIPVRQTFTNFAAGRPADGTYRITIPGACWQAMRDGVANLIGAAGQVPNVGVAVLRAIGWLHTVVDTYAQNGANRARYIASKAQAAAVADGRLAANPADTTAATRWYDGHGPSFIVAATTNQKMKWMCEHRGDFNNFNRDEWQRAWTNDATVDNDQATWQDAFPLPGGGGHANAGARLAWKWIATPPPAAAQAGILAGYPAAVQNIVNHRDDDVVPIIFCLA